MLIERWDFLDSLFMTVTTLTTVGYGEVHPLDTIGKIYTVILILSGVGLLLYILADMVELLLTVNLGRRRMKDKIAKLSNHYIICGYGRTGREIAQHFQGKHIDFLIIELDQDAFHHAENAGLLAIAGDASTDEILIQAQIKKAKGIICALPDDTANTFITLSAKGLNESIAIVCRAGQPGSEAKMRRAGAHMVISPYVICGRRMATAVTEPLVTEFLDVVMHTPGYDLRMEQIKLTPNCRLVGATIADANIKQESGAMILAINQNGKLVTNPQPDFVFASGDELVALGAQDGLERLSILAGAK